LPQEYDQEIVHRSKQPHNTSTIMMSSSQIVSSFLCIGFLFSIVNGFLVIFQPKVSTPHHGASCAHPPSATDRRFGNLHAIKGKSKASETTAIGGGTSSDKVKEMASFLSVQLLQKIMTDAMKPEGESTMNLDVEAVERLTEALQMGSQPSSSETTTEATEDSDRADDAALDPLEIPTTTADTTTEHTLSTPSETMETKSDDAPLFTTITEDDDTTSTSSNPAEILSSETTTTTTTTPTEEKPIEEAEKAVVPPVAEKVSPPVVRKPLEVIQSDIPALRTESIPQKSLAIAEEEDEEETEEEETIAVKSEDAENEEVVSEEIVDAPSPSSDVDENAEESFRRRLLQQKFEFDKKEAATRIENETQVDDDDTACSPPENVVASDQEIETIDTASDSSMERNKADESFRRRLLQQKFEFDKNEAAKEEKEEEYKG